MCQNELMSDQLLLNEGCTHALVSLLISNTHGMVYSHSPLSLLRLLIPNLDTTVCASMKSSCSLWYISCILSSFFLFLFLLSFAFLLPLILKIVVQAIVSGKFKRTSFHLHLASTLLEILQASFHLRSSPSISISIHPRLYLSKWGQCTSGWV